jgi:hypothetical protein
MGNYSHLASYHSQTFYFRLSMSELNPPYPLMLDGLRHGRVIPFLGAGASLSRRDSDATNEAQHGSLAAITKSISEQCTSWNRQHLPTAAELAHYLAQRTEFPHDEQQDLAKVAQYYNVVGGRIPLREDLHTIFSGSYQITPLHNFLASIEAPLLIITTNYDDLIECAFDAVGRVYDRIIHTTDHTVGDRLLWWKHGSDEPFEVHPNKLVIDLSKVTVIYKMHGAVDRLDPKRDQYVITEDDYIDFLVRMTKNKAVPAIFAEPFQTRHFLFLGYGLSDWNLRVVLNRIEKDLRRPKGIKSWAVQRSAKPLERRFWQERGVEVYNMTLEAFVNELTSS